MTDKKNPSSLFLYTALIFLVALIMIILSFFGQGERESMQQQAKSLTEKATAISEQNYLLTEKVSTLEASVETKDSQINQLTKESENYKNLIKANQLLNDEKFEEAQISINNVDSSLLTDESLILYNQLTEKINSERKEEK